MNLEELDFIASTFFKAYGHRNLILNRFVDLDCLDLLKKFIVDNYIKVHDLRDVYRQCLLKYAGNNGQGKEFVEYLRDLGVILVKSACYNDSMSYREEALKWHQAKAYEMNDKLLYPLVESYKNTNLHIIYSIIFNRLDLLQKYGFNHIFKKSTICVQEAVHYILAKNYDVQMLEFLINEGFTTNIDDVTFKHEQFLMKDEEGRLIEPVINKSYLFIAIEQGKADLVRILLREGCRIDKNLTQCLPYIITTDEVQAVLVENRKLFEQVSACRLM